MNGGSPALLQFSINGVPLGAIFSAPASPNIWQQFFAAWNSGANTSITICIVNQNTTASGNDFGLDDISFQQCTYCTATATVTITQPLVLTTTVTSTGVSCFGGANGTAGITSTGGTSPYTYLWSDNQATPGASGLIAGSYSVVITDNNGCTNTQTVTIAQPTAITNSVTSINPNCSTGTGSASASTNGGTGSYSYLWSTTPTQTTQTISGLTTGTYTLSVVDANGCTYPAQTVSVLQPPPIVLTGSATPTTCNANSGAATVNATGGTGTYTYLWNSTAGGQTTSTATGLGSGTYAVVVTDANGCVQIQTVSVTSINALSVSVTSTQTSCSVDDGTTTAFPNSGTSPYSYSWSNGQTTSVATALGSGNYTVTVTDANGCTAVSAANVTSVVGPSVNVIASLSTITLGGNSQLNATGGGSYQWSPATGLSCTSCSNPIATPGSTTIYCVIATDTNGCSDSACVTINVDILCGTFYVPNAFSPNADGEDDDFHVYIGRPDCILSFDLRIYNRWGEKIYETTDPTFAWNGAYNRGTLKNDKPAETAVFVYEMNVEFSDGNKKLLKGNISLMR